MAEIAEKNGVSPAQDLLKKSAGSAPENALAAPGDPYIMYIARAADAMIPWGAGGLKTRDQQLRQFYLSESYFMSALGTVTSRNAGFSWTLDGPEAAVEKAQEMLIHADFGGGWGQWQTKLSTDLYTQDSGAFTEIIRAEDNPNAEVINLRHLDAARCYPTGNPDEPVIYRDREEQPHKLKWYQVAQHVDQPAPHEFMWMGPLMQTQFCSLTKLMYAAQIIRSYINYSGEKMSGQNLNEIHLIRGIPVGKIQEAMDDALLRSRAQGMRHLVKPALVGSADVDAEVGHDTIALASPGGDWITKDQFQLYITILALAFNGDYQDFAPLPGGGLGTSNQSEILHMKSRGKGPAHYQKMIAHFLNFGGILPKGVTFRYDEQDLQAEKDEADLRSVRAAERAARIASTEIDAEAARQLAIDSGDLPQEVYDEMVKRQKEEEEAKAKAEAEFMKAANDQAAAQAAAAAAAPGGNTDVSVQDTGGQSNARPGAGSAVVAQDNARGAKEVPEERSQAEALVETHFASVLRRQGEAILGEVGQLAMPGEDQKAHSWMPFRRNKGVRRRVVARDPQGRPDEVIEEPIL